MRNLKLVALLLLLGVFVVGESTDIEIIEQKQDLSELQLKIIQQIGIENIVSFDVKNLSVSAKSDYPSNPLCQSLEYENNEPDGWVVYEWGGKWFYGITSSSGYAEVEVTNSFANSFCKRNSRFIF